MPKAVESEHIEVKDINRVMVDNYLPYALDTITLRALPYIDGLKPVHRKILYIMYKMGLMTGGKTKSANIVGQTMRLHPHGDLAIYESIVRMTTGSECLLMPYIESKGNFGKVYSRDMAFAASRYTEAKLADICKELFDGIDEDAVEFIDNYDTTTKEPVILPAKFPSILVNTSAGIAVSMASNIASYNLKNVCLATIGILKKEIENTDQLHKVIGEPDFTTGGILHNTYKEFISLLETGKGSITISSLVETYSNSIIVKEIPYRTTIETIIERIEDLVKVGDLREIQDVKDGTDLNGLKIIISIKRGNDVNRVLSKLYKLTPLRYTIGMNNNLLFDGEPIQCGVFDILNMWIKFRISTVNRIYANKLKKEEEKKHLLEAWEIISNRLNEVIDIVMSDNEAVAKEKLMEKFSMSDKQADSILDVRVRDLTDERRKRKLKDLQTASFNIKIYKDIVQDDKLKIDIVVGELESIARMYGTDRKSKVMDVVEQEEDVIINDKDCYVYITKQNYIKRIEGAILNNGQLPIFSGDAFKNGWETKNNKHILVFMYSGVVYKIPILNIDCSKGNPKDSIAKLINDSSEIMYVTDCGDYTGHINILYGNGRGHIIKFNKFNTNRNKYISVFDGGQYNEIWCTTEDEFFIITSKRRAAYVHIMSTPWDGVRTAFKAARISSDDSIYGIQPIKNVPDMKSVDCSVYNRGYCVKIKHALW